VNTFSKRNRTPTTLAFSSLNCPIYTMRMINSIIIVSCALALEANGMPQSGGVSAKVGWWRNGSFNSPSSEYLYSSFRDKVFEPIVDQILGDIQKLRKGQEFIGEVGYGSLSVGILAVLGVIYVTVRMKLTNQTRQTSQNRGREDNSRVL
jgi:hypothetical protein